MDSTSKSLSRGLLAGCAATVPMTVFMIAARRLLPENQRYSLPPYQITMRAADAVGVAQDMDKPQRIGATWLGHLGYGSAMGGVYACTAEKVSAPPLAKGVIYGLLVWAIGYLGWLPLAGILNMPDEQSTRRNILMIAAHVIWGATLGLAHHKLSD